MKDPFPLPQAIRYFELVNSLLVANMVSMVKGEG